MPSQVVFLFSDNIQLSRSVFCRRLECVVSLLILYFFRYLVNSVLWIVDLYNYTFIIILFQINYYCFFFIANIPKNFIPFCSICPCSN